MLNGFKVTLSIQPVSETDLGRHTVNFLPPDAALYLYVSLFNILLNICLKHMNDIFCSDAQWKFRANQDFSDQEIQ